jgi:flagellar biosynthesis protein FlhF
MNDTKLYRAATLREALEKIKVELGEDTLVLGHKRVRAGGFLGVGTREMIEVRVAAEVKPIEGKRKSARAPERKKSDTANKSLLSESQSLLSDEAEESITPGMAALATRAYAETSGAPAAPARHTSLLETPRAAYPSSSSISLSPSVASTLTKTLSPASANHTLTAEPMPARGPSVATELNKLWSEFRELKFSLGVLGRPSLQSGGHHERLTQFDADPEIYDSPYFESYQQLLDTGLAQDMALHVMQLVVRNAARNKTVDSAIADLLDARLNFAEDQLPINPGTPGAPIASVFIGPTGVGKTTTIAKLAAHSAQGARRRVELITLDTYRIAAAEQLKKYAELIGAGCHLARSVDELDALLKQFAGKAKIFIDTAGRSPNDLADQLELADYLRNSQGILKCLVLQATTHPSDAMIAVKKFALFGTDHLVITKLDETTRPGAAVGIVADANLPLAYICAGQRVPDDIQRANPTTLAGRILRATFLAAAAAA